MEHPGTPFLIAGAAFSAIAAALHLACLAFGARWYRALGAGERMRRLVSAGRAFPALVTLAIATMLGAWSAYALSGAGVVGRLPLLRPALCAITGVYLLRAIASAPLAARIRGNSRRFWIVSSVLCLIFGGVHLVGVVLAWPRL